MSANEPTFVLAQKALTVLLASSLKYAEVKTVRVAPGSSDALPLSSVLLRAYCHPAVPPVVWMWIWQLDEPSPGFLAVNSL